MSLDLNTDGAAVEYLRILRELVQTRELVLKKDAELRDLTNRAIEQAGKMELLMKAHNLLREQFDRLRAEVEANDAT